MIVKEEFLKKLKSLFNMNIYEVKIWSALLSRGIASAGELSDISNVPRSRSYDVLESLEKKGFVIMKIGKPIKYIAVDPAEIIKRIKKKIKEDSEDKIKNIEDIKNTEVFKEMELLFKQGINNLELGRISGALKGRKNMNNHLISMISNAKKSISIATSADGFIRKVDNLGSIMKKLSRNKVKIRIVTEINGKNESYAKEVKNFAEIKNIPKFNSRFVIVDGKEIFFMIEDDKKIHESYDSAIWVNTPFFAQAIENMFSNLWKNN
jgi:sugar-specific transcriptional regulator TrmB